LLQDEGLRRMAAAPLGKQLLELDLSGNVLSDGTAILQLVQNNPSLRTLDISNNSFSTKGMEQFVGYGAFHTLQSCDMSRNHICRDADQCLGRALGNSNCQLRELNLDANEMTDCTMESISFGLLSNVSLEKLSLKNNCLGDVGAMKIAISIGLNPNSKLKELKLSNNKIHNAGAVSLMKNTRRNMVKLDLSGNRITDGRSICQILRKDNDSMRQLFMKRNPIPLQHAHEIEFWTRLNSSGGRQLLTKDDCDKKRGNSMSIWPVVLGRISEDSNGLYYFLIRKPELCLSGSSNHKK
jgi:Ran GTPase-activating protein (RanGAP) involved in mRNA processing and transport